MRAAAEAAGEVLVQYLMELKVDQEIDPTLGHLQPWVPVQGSVQKAGRNFQDPESKEEQKRPAQDVTVMPVRAVEAGVLRFETWIERQKENAGGASQSSVSGTLG